MSQTIQIALTGRAVVHCPHDRQKRQITTESQIAALGRELGQTYDPRQHHLATCPCCENVFVNPTDIPRLCHACTQPNVHPLGGPIPDPTGGTA